jgi:hypothetical protein
VLKKIIDFEKTIKEWVDSGCSPMDSVQKNGYFKKMIVLTIKQYGQQRDVYLRRVSA